MREFTYYTEHYNEKFRKHDPYKVNLWMRETSYLYPPLCKTSLLSHTLALILEVSSQFILPIPSYFCPFTIKQVDNLSNVIVSPEQVHVALRNIENAFPTRNPKPTTVKMLVAAGSYEFSGLNITPDYSGCHGGGRP